MKFDKRNVAMYGKSATMFYKYPKELWNKNVNPYDYIAEAINSMGDGYYCVCILQRYDFEENYSCVYTFYDTCGCWADDWNEGETNVYFSAVNLNSIFDPAIVNAFCKHKDFYSRENYENRDIKDPFFGGEK